VLGTQLRMSSVYHPQTDGQSERTIQSLEDLLRAYVLDHMESWSAMLPLVEFTYNNNYHSSIGMAPYEALYERRCRTPLCWNQSRQKSYANKRRRPLEFEVGDHVFLKVTPMTGIGGAIKSRKLTPRFVGPYQILIKIGAATCEIALPPHLANIYNVFHVSQLRKYIEDPSHVLESNDIQIREALTVNTGPVQILDSQVKKL